MLNKIRDFVIAAHMCGSGCFNANQVLQKKYLRDADNRLWNTWIALPGWLRRFLLKGIEIRWDRVMEGRCAKT